MDASSRAFTASAPGGKTKIVSKQALSAAGVNPNAKSADALSPKDRRKLSTELKKRTGGEVNLVTQKTMSKADRQTAAAKAGFGRKKDLLSSEQKGQLTRANQIRSQANAVGAKELARKASSKIGGLKSSAKAKERSAALDRKERTGQIIFAPNRPTNR